MWNDNTETSNLHSLKAHRRPHFNKQSLIKKQAQWAAAFVSVNPRV